MTLAFVILGIIGACWGALGGSTTRTMSSGPRQGATFGGIVVTAGVGAAYGLIVGLVASFNILGAIGIGLLVSLVAFGVAYLVAQNLKR